MTWNCSLVEREAAEPAACDNAMLCPSGSAFDHENPLPGVADSDSADCGGSGWAGAEFGSTRETCLSSRGQSRRSYSMNRPEQDGPLKCVSVSVWHDRIAAVSGTEVWDWL